MSIIQKILSGWTADGIEFTNRKSLEAEIKLVLPDWQPHSFMKDLPIVDKEEVVITDLTMRNPDYPQIFAVGDAAALTVAKLGTLGDMQARIVALQIAKDLGKVSAERADEPFRPVVICMGDMGRDKAFYSDVWVWWNDKHHENESYDLCLKISF